MSVAGNQLTAVYDDTGSTRSAASAYPGAPGLWAGGLRSLALGKLSAKGRPGHLR